MHYFIDGYNFLFRHSMRDAETSDLKRVREKIVVDLNEKISLLKWNVSLVFDATFQEGEHTRGHFDAMEIHFTAFGQTADDYIIESIRYSKNPSHEIVVTSDKKLATIVKGLSARTESCEDFMHRINRCFENKRVPKTISKKELIKSSLIKTPQKNPLSVEGSSNYYEKVFVESFEKMQTAARLLEKEHQEKNPPKCPPRRPKPKKCRFEEPLSSEEKTACEMDRWLKIFEKKINL